MTEKKDPVFFGKSVVQKCSFKEAPNEWRKTFQKILPEEEVRLEATPSKQELFEDQFIRLKWAVILAWVSHKKWGRSAKDVRNGKYKRPKLGIKGERKLLDTYEPYAETLYRIFELILQVCSKIPKEQKLPYKNPQNWFFNVCQEIEFQPQPRTEDTKKGNIIPDMRELSHELNRQIKKQPEERENPFSHEDIPAIATLFDYALSLNDRATVRDYLRPYIKALKNYIKFVEKTPDQQPLYKDGDGIYFSNYKRKQKLLS